MPTLCELLDNQTTIINTLSDKVTNAQTTVDTLIETLMTIEECACCPEPPLATIRCTSYGSFGSGSLTGRLANPGQYDDPASNGPAGSPDYSCPDFYDIKTVVYDAQITTDGGATWTPLIAMTGGPITVSEWASSADAPAQTASEMVDWINSRFEVQSAGVTFAPTNTGWSVEKPADADVRILYGFIYNSDGSSDCMLDPYHRQWTDDFYVMGSDGEAVWLQNSAANDPAWLTQAPTPGDYAAAAAVHDVTTVSLQAMEDCEAI